jgi:hypothetical protein
MVWQPNCDMKFQVKFDINEKIFLRDPESSDLGRLMVNKAIDLISQLGFEQFNFRKLAVEISSTEASIYRYFENKHRLLLYLINWYWCYLKFLITFKIESVADKKEQFRIIIHLLTDDSWESDNCFSYNKKHLDQIVITDSSKAYLIKDVIQENEQQIFKPYDDLCIMIAEIISSYNPQYKFPKSLSSTLIETAHRHQFFSNNLPELTDVDLENKRGFTKQFLEDLVFGVLQANKCS